MARNMSIRGSPVGALAGAFVTIALTLGACGGGDEDATPSPSSSPTGSATATPARTASGSRTPTPAPADTPAGIELDEFVIRPAVTRARPGTVAFTVTNAGELAHQFVVIKSDLPIAQLPRLANDEGVDEDQVDVVDKIEAIAPGKSAELSVPASEGKYVLICNIFAAGESHYLSGMYNLFTVDPSAPAPSPSATP